jgi:Flp pilus assembly protein TadG
MNTETNRRPAGPLPLCFRTAGAEDQGAEVFEFALAAALVLTLLFGIISLGRGYSAYQAMVRAVREGARELVLTNCATCANANTAYAAPYVRANFVNPALQSAGLDPTKVTNYASQYVWIDASSSPPQQCGVAISFNYPYQIVIPFVSINLSTITLHTQVQMRLENQPTTCSAGSSVP